jgi:hypothetical protein
VARHRHAVVELVPPRLRTFDPRQWPSWQAWSDARFEWAAAGYDRWIDGKDVLDILFEVP